MLVAWTLSLYECGSRYFKRKGTSFYEWMKSKKSNMSQENKIELEGIQETKRRVGAEENKVGGNLCRPTCWGMCGPLTVHYHYHHTHHHHYIHTDRRNTDKIDPNEIGIINASHRLSVITTPPIGSGIESAIRNNTPASSPQV